MSAKMSSETDHLSGLGSSVPTGTDTVVSGNSEGGKESAPSQGRDKVINKTLKIRSQFLCQLLIIVLQDLFTS